MQRKYSIHNWKRKYQRWPQFMEKKCSFQKEFAANVHCSMVHLSESRKNTLPVYRRRWIWFGIPKVIRNKSSIKSGWIKTEIVMSLHRLGYIFFIQREKQQKIRGFFLLNQGIYLKFIRCAIHKSDLNFKFVHFYHHCLSFACILNYSRAAISLHIKFINFFNCRTYTA